MISFLRRLRWRNLSVRTKVSLIFGAQALIILLLGLASFLALNRVESETTNALATSLALHERVRNLGTDHEELRDLEENIVPAYYDPLVYARAESIAARYQELVTEDLQDETEAILALAANMEPGLRAQTEGQVNALRQDGLRADEGMSEVLTIVANLGDPEEGQLAGLEASAQALQTLVLSQDDTALTGAFLRMRQQEAAYIVTRSNRDSNALQASIEACADAYDRIPSDDRVAGIDTGLEDYGATLAGVSEQFDDLDRQLDNIDTYHTRMGAAIDNMSDVAGRRFAGGVEAIGRTQSVANTLVTVGVAVAFLIGAIVTFSFGRGIVTTMLEMIEVTRRVSEGDFSIRAIVHGEDEFNRLADNLNAMAEQLEEMVANLERRVLERTRDLTLTAEISHSIAGLRDPKELMDEVVELIRRSFNLYHAQVFLIDPSGQNAELVASTGEAGLALLARKHSLPVGSRSVIGQVTSLGEPVIAGDTSTDPIHRRNELLPDTRSEMALPLRVGERIVGALDVQSVKADAFRQDDVAVLQMVADQLAIADRNARLYAQAQRALVEIEGLNRRLLGRAWLSHTQQMRDQEIELAYRLREEGVEPHTDGLTPLLDQAIYTGRLVTASDPGEDELHLAVPIKVRGEVIGAFGFGGETLRDPTDDELALIQGVVDRVGLALENMRLFEETQRLARREHLVNEITAKIVGSTDVNTILQTTVKELGRVLRAPQVSVQLHRESEVDEREEG
jgi:GAF domain-containing protein/methyl-accepting chemotaxis protein